MRQKPHPTSTPPASDQGHPDPVLAEILRQAERVIDHQVRAIEELDDKSEHMLTLGVAVLGGGAALATLAVQSVHPFIDVGFLSMLAAAGSLNLLAILLFLGSYIGFRSHTEIHVGPSLEWMESKSNDSAWGLADLYLSVIKDMPSYYRWNNAREIVSARRRRRATYALLASVAGYGTTFLYILSRSIGGI